MVLGLNQVTLEPRQWQPCAWRCESVKRQTGNHVIQIKTVGELIEALKFVATDDALTQRFMGGHEGNVRLRMGYEMEAYEWSCT
jgi:hypothetical protein